MLQRAYWTGRFLASSRKFPSPSRISNKNHSLLASNNPSNNYQDFRHFSIINTMDRLLNNRQPQEAPLDTLDDNEEILKELSEAYSVARQENSSKWLDFGKSCYIYLYRGGGEPSSALAAFDLDGTIIKPKSNKRIPKSATDWQLFSVWTKIKIQQALQTEQNARFVIFTNQNGVGLKLVALEEVQERVELVTKRLNFPCTVFVAIDKDEFRKPRVGMFRLFEKSFNNSIALELEKSFYCGDAVGYPSHSDADIEFARTLRIPFLAPDKFLRGVKPKLLDEQEK